MAVLFPWSKDVIEGGSIDKTRTRSSTLKNLPTGIVRKECIISCSFSVVLWTSPADAKVLVGGACVRPGWGWSGGASLLL